MNNSNINKNFKASKIENLDWKIVQDHMKKKLGLDIYESWLKKIDFVEEINNYVLLSVPTRFIRDWITSRYLDQILNIIRIFKKDIIRIEFKIAEKKTGLNQDEENFKLLDINETFSFMSKSLKFSSSWLSSVFCSAILNSIRIISFLKILMIFKI